MDKMIFTSLSGQKYVDKRTQQLANDMASIGTVGFKQQLAAATEAYRYEGSGHQSRIVPVIISSRQIDLREGPMQRTGRPLDIALSGNQLLAVLTTTGDIAYTRRGDLIIDGSGILRTGSGLQLASDADAPITVGGLTDVKIGADGTVFGRQDGAEAAVFQSIARIKVVESDPTKVVLRTDGLFESKDRTPFSAAATPVVQSGVLEGSNVSLVSAMVDMIGMSRRYEMQVKIMKQASDLAERSQSLARLTQ
jgi:flagellar basal-body rod protein FlgF